MSYKNIIVEIDGRVGVVSFNRPQVLNALNDAMIDELVDAFEKFDQDDVIQCLILKGSEKAFAAGADISAMADKSYMGAYKENFLTRNWDRLRNIRKPIIAAVSGYALGGGCEIAMICDIVIASADAQFGQPEIKIGIIPGAGGTQRLPRAISKTKAMDMCLSGRMMNAQEAERAGLVSRVVPTAELQREAMATAQKIASFSQPVIMMIKESINAAYETTLTQGVALERRLFHSTFATADQKEGMRAFLDKRVPSFKDR